MKITKTIKFEPKDYKLIDELQHGKCVNLAGQPKEMVDLLHNLSLLFDYVNEITANMALFSEHLKDIPPDIKHRYFGDFIDKYYSTIQNSKQCPFCGHYYDESQIVGGYMVCPNCGHKLLDDPSFKDGEYNDNMS